MVHGWIAFAVVQRKQVGNDQNPGIGAEVVAGLMHQVSSEIEGPAEFAKQVVLGSRQKKAVVSFRESVVSKAVSTGGGQGASAVLFCFSMCVVQIKPGPDFTEQPICDLISHRTIDQKTVPGILIQVVSVSPVRVYVIGGKIPDHISELIRAGAVSRDIDRSRHEVHGGKWIGGIYSAQGTVVCFGLDVLHFHIRGPAVFWSEIGYGSRHQIEPIKFGAGYHTLIRQII